MMFRKKEKSNAAVKQQTESTRKLEASLDANIRLFKEIFTHDDTLVISEFTSRSLQSSHFCIFYMDGMINTTTVNEHIIAPLVGYQPGREISSKNLILDCKERIMSAGNSAVESDLNKLLDAVLYGDTLLLIDGFDTAIVIDTKGFKTRDVSDPESAKLNRGPREGFTESILTNITLIRRRLKSPKLKFKFRNIGELSQTKVCVSYIDGVAQEMIIEELERRLDAIKIDGILDSGYIQELIRDAPFSPFETVGHSERPDVVASRLLEGRVAVFVDGSPFILTVPFVFIENLQAGEDYYNNYIFSSINRMIRITGTIVSGSIPALYVAVTTFHQEMLPTPLLISIAASRISVPFPTVFSMIFMLLIFDTLREAGTRMPTTIGQAINIVGTLVLGQAVIEAKLVSAPIIIITAISGITTLLNYNLIGPNMLVKYLMLVASAIIGVYGFLFIVILLIYHLVSIRSFGIPYMLNMTSVRNYNSQDIWIRVPWWSMKLRPKMITARNLIRQKTVKPRGAG
jgi:spore germination protein KA